MDNATKYYRGELGRQRMAERITAEQLHKRAVFVTRLTRTDHWVQIQGSKCSLLRGDRAKQNIDVVVHRAFSRGELMEAIRTYEEGYMLGKEVASD